MHSLKVLIVDDGNTESNVVCEALSHANIDYAIVSDSSIAITKIQSYKPNIVILDLNMSDLSGVEVCNLIKLDPSMRHIKVIFLSASDNDKDILNGVRMQVVDYLHKPVPIKELLDHILIHDLTSSLTTSFTEFEITINTMNKKWCGPTISLH